MKAPVIYAHRGASKQAPENTMAAFRRAIELGAGGIELDVHLSSDGYLVVTHDEILGRTSNGTGLLKDKTLDELKSLDFGAWFSDRFKGERIPELEDVLKLVLEWDGILNIEMKNGPILYPGIEKAVSEAVEKYKLANRVIISCMNHYSLVEMNRVNPALVTAPLYTEGLYEPWEYARRIGASAIHPNFYGVVPEIVAGCRQNGIRVNPWTVDQPEYIKALVAAGVDGIITNVPDIALDIIKKMGGGV